ncbi:DUF1877 family protein [Streptomyces antibioticus]|uniref:DUF1877 family protein n=1 Tax=Streptomyces antibioticus TaxID=1890 RepID=A0AAE7CJC9_STRAT|nr:DUF1877 family protein [Streptomyces antibioticus]OOQ54271.1 hypothetical protein AFM16_06805 [Streptomyces antibioticus]QIT43282.1 DUF1877 family protein [Streptomyces antibioticus]
MALTQQLARVSVPYLDRCRDTALDSPGAAPGWDPPDTDLLDTDWGLWGLLWYGRRADADAEARALIQRAIDGDPGGNIGFLDHDEVYDGYGDPPRLLAPEAVRELSRGLDAIDLDAYLAALPASPGEAAEACGFGGFNGDVREYLVRHFEALRMFYREAAERGLCVLTWID